MLNRRDFSCWVAGSAAAMAAGAAMAQSAPIAGKHYTRLPRQLAVASADKIDVIEFFWYGCPHCNAFEPALEPWVKALPPDVAFRRVPVAFRAEPFVAHQKLYYALEALGQVEALHGKVFAAIHGGGRRLDKLADISAFVASHGVDAKKFADVYDSFQVQSKVRQAKQLSEAYDIDGVPALGVHGRFYTSGTQAGPAQNMLKVADYLIAQVRASR